MTASTAANDENFVKNYNISVFVKIETNPLFAIGTAV